MLTNEEAIAAMRQRQIARMRLNYLFNAAWREIAEERGYRWDRALGTSSHLTIASRAQALAFFGV